MWQVVVGGALLKLEGQDPFSSLLGTMLELGGLEVAQN